MSKKNEVRALTQFEVNLTSLLEKGVEAIPSGVNSDRLKVNALMAISQDSTLMPLAKKQPAAVSQYVYNFIVQGLDMLNNEAYLVPFKGKLTPVIDYRGEKKIAMQYSVKPIKHIKSGVVHENDHYKNDVDGFEHTFDPFQTDEQRGDRVGAYCSIIYKDGTIQDVFVNREEVNRVRGVSPSSQSSFSPWNKWESSMWEKTVIRKAMNRYVQLDFGSTEVLEAYKESSEDVQFGNQRQTVQDEQEDANVFDVEYEEQQEDDKQEEVIIDID